MKVEFDRAKFMRNLQTNVKRAVAAGAADLQENVKERLSRKSSNIGAGGIASLPGEPPAKNTGALARSIQMVDATKDANNPTYRVGTNNIYAKIQEYGGRINAKKRKFLAVPVGVEGRRAARQAKGDIRSLNLTLIRSKAGKLLLVKQTRKYMTILFRLVKFVILPPRPYMRPAYLEMQTKIHKRIADAMKNTLSGVTK